MEWPYKKVSSHLQNSFAALNSIDWSDIKMNLLSLFLTNAMDYDCGPQPPGPQTSTSLWPV